MKKILIYSLHIVHSRKRYLSGIKVTITEHTTNMVGFFLVFQISAYHSQDPCHQHCGSFILICTRSCFQSQLWRGKGAAWNWNRWDRERSIFVFLPAMLWLQWSNGTYYHFYVGEDCRALHCRRWKRFFGSSIRVVYVVAVFWLVVIVTAHPYRMLCSHSINVWAIVTLDTQQVVVCRLS